MFNTLSEYFQSLVKERRRPPTDGLRKAFEESLGRGVSMPSSPVVGSITGLSCPHRGVSCRDHEMVCFDRVQNPVHL